MDQDVGSSVIKCFSEHPRVIREGAEADDCKLSGYIHIYINGCIGGTKILDGKKYKHNLNYHKHCFYNSDTCYSNIIFFEH